MSKFGLICFIGCFIAMYSTACNSGGNGADGDYPVYNGDQDNNSSEQDQNIIQDGDTAEEDADSPLVDGDLDDIENSDSPEYGFEFPEITEQEQTEADNPVDGDEDSVGMFCYSFEDCPGDDICNFSLGRCEKRRSLSTFEIEIYSFHPPEVAVGDLLVVDGNGFLGSNLLLPANYSVSVGSTVLGGMFNGISADENRVLVPVNNQLSGAVGITVGGFVAQPSSELVGVAQTGVIGCDGRTPYASYENGSRLGEVGPYASGYLDFLEDDMRIFYPAECGSIRRKPIEGEFPLVIILHGNGALHINYEYIAELLATWGFVSLIPLSQSENDSPPEVSEYIYDRIAPFINADLGEINPVLDGLTTLDEIAMIGHSRGCARMQNVYNLYPELFDKGKASVWLGPAQDANMAVPGYFLLIGADKDGQSLLLTNFNPAWEKASAPKCKIFIKGGNHSLFGDHKIYKTMDGIPTITRKQQLSIVNSYVLPLMQMAFSQTELWPEQFDNPTGSAIYDITCQWE